MTDKTDDQTEDTTDPTGAEQVDADQDAGEGTPNAEAKKYRLKLREAEAERDDLRAQLDAMKAVEQEQAQARDRAEWVADAARKARLDPAAVGLLRGESPDELLGHACELAKIAPDRRGTAPREGILPTHQPRTTWNDLLSPDRSEPHGVSRID